MVICFLELLLSKRKRDCVLNLRHGFLLPPVPPVKPLPQPIHLPPPGRTNSKTSAPSHLDTTADFASIIFLDSEP